MPGTLAGRRAEGRLRGRAGGRGAPLRGALRLCFDWIGWDTFQHICIYQYIYIQHMSTYMSYVYVYIYIYGILLEFAVIMAVHLPKIVLNQCTLF